MSLTPPGGEKGEVPRAVHNKAQFMVGPRLAVRTGGEVSNATTALSRPAIAGEFSRITLGYCPLFSLPHALTVWTLSGIP